MTAPDARRWRLAVRDLLPSTSDVCHARALAGEPDGLAVLALRQTQGRGTNGRAWQSPPGNLYLSVLLRPEEPARRAGEWSLLAAVALAEALAGLLPDPGALALKWPNDVLLHGAKLAGILTESVAAPDGAVDFIVIGFGVNIAVAPAVPDRPTACLAAVATPPGPEAIAATVLDRLDQWRARRARDGFAAVRTAWLARGPLPGAPIVLRIGQAMREGAFAGLGADGSLLLATGARVQSFAAGEVMAAQTRSG